MMDYGLAMEGLLAHAVEREDREDNGVRLMRACGGEQGQGVGCDAAGLPQELADR